MINIPFVSFMFSPRAVREAAAERAEISAIAVNALNGMFFVAAVFIPMLLFFAVSLVTLLIVLFGPLVGFIVSSLYARIEWRVGRKLGGKSSLDELYRLFAWSFLPVGVAELLFSMIILPLKDPSTAAMLAASIPSLVILCCAIRNYCSKIIVLQQFSKKRGIVSIVLSFVLFIILIAAGIGLITLLFRYGMGDTLKSAYTLQ